MPALLTNRSSSSPCASTSQRTKPVTESRFERSRACASIRRRASAPSSLARIASAASSGFERVVITTEAPQEASVRAVSNPREPGLAPGHDDLLAGEVDRLGERCLDEARADELV